MKKRAAYKNLEHSHLLTMQGLQFTLKQMLQRQNMRTPHTKFILNICMLLRKCIKIRHFLSSSQGLTGSLTDT